MELDAIDKLAAKAFKSDIVRKDLVRRFEGASEIHPFSLRTSGLCSEIELNDGRITYSKF